MTNLIERLRDKAARFHRMHWKRDYEDISDAADEIERLKAELFTMRNVFHQQDAEIERLEAWKDEHSRTEGGECPYCEIERLLLTISWTRATLEEIAKGCDLSNEAQAIAREALREADDGH